MVIDKEKGIKRTNYRPGRWGGEIDFCSRHDR